MTKLYKRKEYIEKNSNDKDKLDKITKKSFNSSNRQEAKRNIEKELENNDESYEKNGYYELELEMSNLCYKLSRLDKNYKCTCPSPRNEKIALNHIEYLNKEIIKNINKNS